MTIYRTILSGWIKFRSVTSHRVAVGAAMGLPVLLAPLVAKEVEESADLIELANVIPAITGLGSVFLGSLAVVLVTGEHNYGTINQTLLCTSSPSRVAFAKGAMAALVAFVATVVTSAAVLVAMWLTVREQTWSAISDQRIVGSLAATWLAAPLIAIAGTAFGTAFRNSSAALTTFLAWTLLEDEIIGSILRACGADRAVHWLPYTALAESTLVYPDPGALGRSVALIYFATALATALAIFIVRAQIHQGRDDG